MKIKATCFNIDKPNANYRYYSKDVLDEALSEFCQDKPLYLLSEMPKNKGIDMTKVIGTGVKSEWSEDNTRLIHTFKLRDDINLENKYPCFFGVGNLTSELNGVYIVEDLKIQGFALCDSCAWETKVEIVKEVEDENRI